MQHTFVWILLAREGKANTKQEHTKNSQPSKTNVIKVEDLLHGDCVSTDQFECRVKGQILHTRGKEDLELMYSGGTIFVYHASKYISVYHQVSLGGLDTV